MPEISLEDRFERLKQLAFVQRNKRAQQALAHILTNKNERRTIGKSALAVLFKLGDLTKPHMPLDQLVENSENPQDKKKLKEEARPQIFSSLKPSKEDRLVMLNQLVLIGETQVREAWFEFYAQEVLGGVTNNENLKSQTEALFLFYDVLRGHVRSTPKLKDPKK